MWGTYNKYRNEKIICDGMTFDSKKEYRRWCELCLLEKAGEIKDLQRQIEFELIPAQRIDGKVVERKCSYVADFVYHEGAELIVEDSKGVKTKEYIIKRKLMLQKYGIQIREV